MSETISRVPVTHPSRSSRAFDTILYGVSRWNSRHGIRFHFLRPDIGRTAIANFQSVAAGLLGRNGRVSRRNPDFHARILLHFVVAACIATVYYRQAGFCRC